MKLFLNFISLLVIFSLPSCKEQVTNNCTGVRKHIGQINNQKIYLEEVDSTISQQVYELRMMAINELIHKYILEEEAKRSNLTLQELIQEKIIKSSKIVTDDVINMYLLKNNILPADTPKIKNYLKSINQKERHLNYVDSLKKFSDIKIFLQPPSFKNITTQDLYTYNITNANKGIEVIIISDFSCPACQDAENVLNSLYMKYKDEVCFKFIFFSSYIGESSLACEAAARQNKFKEMHDIIFQNSSILNNDSIYFQFAKELELNMAEFNKDINDIKLLKKLINNKELLISKDIFSTPTFIVNNKVLDGLNAIDYLEDVIKNDIHLLTQL